MIEVIKVMKETAKGLEVSYEVNENKGGDVSWYVGTFTPEQATELKAALNKRDDI